MTAAVSPPGYFASVSGHRIVEGSITIPEHGAWTADVKVSDATNIAGSVSVVLGGLTLAGYAYRQFPFAGANTLRIVGGAGGWGQAVKPRSYYLTGGVPLGMVLGDLAKDVGETIALANPGTLGQAYVRVTPTNTTAGDLLSELVSLVGLRWWVDPSGTTRVATARTGAAIQTAYQVIDYHGGTGWADVATESMQDWMPGNTFDGPTIGIAQPIGMTTFVVGNDGKLRARVLVAGTGAAGTLAGAQDRMWAPFRRLVRTETFALRLYGTYEYTIQATDGTTVDAAPTDTTTGCPQINKAELRADTIATQTPTTGQLCHVVFANGDPRKPKVVWCQPSPASAAIAGGGAAVARVGDSVNIGLLQAGPYPVSTGGAGLPLSATISGGSSKVTCG